jgi:hypothetical protein
MSMPTNEEYEARIKKMKWPQLRRLWEALENRDTPDWEPGKAFESLVLRMFDLDGALVRWPYEVNLPCWNMAAGRRICPRC